MAARRLACSTRIPIRSLVVAVVSGFQAVQYFAVGFYLPVIVGLIFGRDVVSTVIGTILLNVFGLLGGSIQPSSRIAWADECSP